jgi:hypothetical protein
MRNSGVQPGDVFVKVTFVPAVATFGGDTTVDTEVQGAELDKVK